jgi:hypothetical protein
MSSLKNKVEVLNFFKQNLLKFLDALSTLLPNEQDIIMLRVMFETHIPIESAMQTFSIRILPYKEMVEKRDDRFFLECTDVFAGIRKDKVSYFKDLWQSNLSQENRKTLWDWFTVFLRVAVRYNSLDQQQ